jgi:hypothetical protein
LCPATDVVQEVWSFPGGTLGSESSLASQPSLVDIAVMLMRSSADTPLPLGFDSSLDLVFSHPIQLAIMSMQSSVDTPLSLGVDASLGLVFSHPIQPMVEEVVSSMKSFVDPTLILESNNPK